MHLRISLAGTFREGCVDPVFFCNSEAVVDDAFKGVFCVFIVVCGDVDLVARCAEVDDVCAVFFNVGEYFFDVVDAVACVGLQCECSADLDRDGFYFFRDCLEERVFEFFRCVDFVDRVRVRLSKVAEETVKAAVVFDDLVAEFLVHCFEVEFEFFADRFEEFFRFFFLFVFVEFFYALVHADATQRKINIVGLFVDVDDFGDDFFAFRDVVAEVADSAGSDFGDVDHPFASFVFIERDEDGVVEDAFDRAEKQVSDFRRSALLGEKSHD